MEVSGNLVMSADGLFDEDWKSAENKLDSYFLKRGWLEVVDGYILESNENCVIGYIKQSFIAKDIKMPNCSFGGNKIIENFGDIDNNDVERKYITGPFKTMIICNFPDENNRMDVLEDILNILETRDINVSGNFLIREKDIEEDSVVKIVKIENNKIETREALLRHLE